MSISNNRLNMIREALLDEIERLERELAHERNKIGMLVEKIVTTEAQAAAMREALLFLIDRFNFDSPTEAYFHIKKSQEKAISALSTDAGRKVLDVVEAAENYSRTLDILESSAVEINLARVKLRQALAAMGK